MEGSGERIILWDQGLEGMAEYVKEGLGECRGMGGEGAGE